MTNVNLSFEYFKVPLHYALPKITECYFLLKTESKQEFLILQAIELLKKSCQVFTWSSNTFTLSPDQSRIILTGQGILQINENISYPIEIKCFLQSSSNLLSSLAANQPIKAVITSMTRLYSVANLDVSSNCYEIYYRSKVPSLDLLPYSTQFDEEYIQHIQTDVQESILGPILGHFSLHKKEIRHNTTTTTTQSSTRITNPNLLLVGRAGLGGSSMIYALARQKGFSLVRICPGNLFQSGIQLASTLLLQAFAAVQSMTNGILCLEDLHILCPSTSGTSTGSIASQELLLEQLVYHIHHILQNPNVFVIATCSQETLVSSTIFKTFEQTVYLDHRSFVHQDRLLQQLSSRHINTSKYQNITIFQCLLLLYQSYSQQIDIDSDISNSIQNLSLEDSSQTLSAISSYYIQQLNPYIVWPIQYQYLFRSLRSSPTKQTNSSPISHLLLYGPPGCGKSYFPKIYAHYLRFSCIEIKLSETIKGHIGGTEDTLRHMFAEAKRLSPSILFIDEFQSLTMSNSSLESSNDSENTILSAMSKCFDDIKEWNQYAGIASSVLIIATSRTPWDIDKSFLVPGRLETKISMTHLPQTIKQQFISHYLTNILPISLSEIQYEGIYEILQDASIADIKYFGKQLQRKIILLQEKIKNIHKENMPCDEDIVNIILELCKTWSPSLPIHVFERYDNWK